MSHSPQPLTWQEKRDAVIAKELGAVFNDMYGAITVSGLEMRLLSRGNLYEEKAWASAYARLFPSSAVSIPSVDWNDDEKVVRGRWPEAYQGNNKKSDYVWATEGSRIAWLRSSDNSPMKEVAGFLGRDWPSARQHLTVQAYERTHRMTVSRAVRGIHWNPEAVSDGK